MSRAQLLIRDDVRRLQRSDYDRVLDAYLAALSGLRGVSAVYQLGNLRVPGISDIDLIIVVDERLAPGTDFHALLRATTGADGAYLFSHPPYVIGRTGFAHLPLLFFADNLRHRCGEVLAFEVPEPAQADFCGYLIAVEAAIGQSFPLLRSLTDGRALNLRSLLCHLNAIRHNFSTIARWIDCGSRAHWADYVVRIDRLREGWFDAPQAERFAEVSYLLPEARRILFEVLAELAVIGQAQGFLRGNGTATWFSLLDVNLLLRFAPSGAVGTSRLVNPLSRLRDRPILRHALARHRRLREALSDVTVLELPAALYPLVGSWAENHGEVARVLRARQLNGEHNGFGALPAQIQAWMARRQAVLDAYLGFVRRLDIRGALLLTPATWLTPARSLANRLKTRWNRRWVGRRLAACP